jgi:methionine-S-sulfoxide reductase
MTKQAIFAAGCFWGVQFYFDQVPGVTKTICGFTGGHTQNPTTDEVYTHTTGHAEAVLVDFDPQQVSYKTLLKHFFRLHNPTQLNRQGPDIGDSYRSAIFYFDEDQKAEALKAKTEAQKDWKEPIVTQISPITDFYTAEDYHQKFAERTGRGMCHIPYQPV